MFLFNACSMAEYVAPCAALPLTNCKYKQFYFILSENVCKV